MEKSALNAYIDKQHQERITSSPSKRLVAPFGLLFNPLVD